MRHTALKEITFKEIQNNVKEYYENRQQFFIKTKHVKGLRTAYLHRFEDENLDNLYAYGFEFDDDYDEGYIQHVYILK